MTTISIELPESVFSSLGKKPDELAREMKELSQLEKPPNMNNEPILNKSLTDWQRLETMEDEDIDFSDCPEITPAQFTKATVHRQTKYIPRKEPVMLNIDADVMEWFKSQGESYQNQINALLRDYMQTHQS